MKLFGSADQHHTEKRRGCNHRYGNANRVWIGFLNLGHGYCFVVRFPIAQSAPVVRMKICPSEIAGELSV